MKNSKLKFSKLSTISSSQSSSSAASTLPGSFANINSSLSAPSTGGGLGGVDRDSEMKKPQKSR